MLIFVSCVILRPCAFTDALPFQSICLPWTVNRKTSHQGRFRFIIILRTDAKQLVVVQDIFRVFFRRGKREGVGILNSPRDKNEGTNSSYLATRTGGEKGRHL